MRADGSGLGYGSLRRMLVLRALTAAPLWVAEPDVTAGAGRVLLGALGCEQVVQLGVERLQGGVNLIVLGPDRGLISSVLLIDANVIATTRCTRGTGGTGKSGGTLWSSTETTKSILSPRPPGTGMALLLRLKAYSGICKL